MDFKFLLLQRIKYDVGFINFDLNQYHLKMIFRKRMFCTNFFIPFVIVLLLPFIGFLALNRNPFLVNFPTKQLMSHTCALVLGLVLGLAGTLPCLP